MGGTGARVEEGRNDSFPEQEEDEAPQLVLVDVPVLVLIHHIEELWREI